MLHYEIVFLNSLDATLNLDIVKANETVSDITPGKSGHQLFGNTDRRCTHRNRSMTRVDQANTGNTDSMGSTDNPNNMGTPNNRDNHNPTTPGTHKNRKKKNNHGRKNGDRRESAQNRPCESLRTGPPHLSTHPTQSTR